MPTSGATELGGACPVRPMSRPRATRTEAGSRCLSAEAAISGDAPTGVELPIPLRTLPIGGIQIVDMTTQATMTTTSQSNGTTSRPSPT